MQALILAGGSGTRFWPMSRRLRPKQLLALDGEASLLRATFERLVPLVPPEAVWVCTTADLAAAVRRELPEVPAEQVLVEPEGRNTAPAIAWSVASMPAAARAGVVAVLPADHRIGEPERFREVLGRAARVAGDADRVVALGITPHRPETGYGYLELAGEAAPAPAGSGAAAAAAAPAGGVRSVLRFVEKPDRAAAERYVASGRYLWNAGIFVFRGDRLLELIDLHEPELGQGLRELAAAPERLAEIYRRLPARSIDYAVMEKLADIATLALDCGWSDLGSWEALAEVLPEEAGGNQGRGDRLAVDASGNLLFADAGTIAVLGVQDLVVVRTGDAVMVVPKARAQEVKRLVQELAAKGREDLL